MHHFPEKPASLLTSVSISGLVHLYQIPRNSQSVFGSSAAASTYSCIINWSRTPTVLPLRPLNDWSLNRVATAPATSRVGFATIDTVIQRGLCSVSRAAKARDSPRLEPGIALEIGPGCQGKTTGAPPTVHWSAPVCEAALCAALRCTTTRLLFFSSNIQSYHQQPQPHPYLARQHYSQILACEQSFDSSVSTSPSSVFLASGDPWIRQSRLQAGCPPSRPPAFLRAAHRITAPTTRRSNLVFTSSQPKRSTASSVHLTTQYWATF